MNRDRRPLLADRRGATLVEFALIAPTMLLMIMGLGDVMHRAYVQSVLDGAMQKAGRDAAVEGGANRAAAIDAKVQDMVRSVAFEPVFESKRENYRSFLDMKPERFTDGDGDGARDPGECFDDINANRTWDVNPARTGQGGAQDTVMYRITVTYPRLFPLAGLLGWSRNQVLSAKTLLKNQPFAGQANADVVVVCTP